MLSAGISNATKGKYFAYYTPLNMTDPAARNDSFSLSGPRSILARLSTATAASGQILPITPPFPNSSYSIQFVGPYVSCDTANSTVEQFLDAFLKQYDGALQQDSLNKTWAYYAFVPTFDRDDDLSTIELNGTSISAMDQTRLQQKPWNATNELWMKFTRYLRDDHGNLVFDEGQRKIPEPKYVSCNLWNASFNTKFSYESWNQTIQFNDITLLNPVSYPSVQPDQSSDLAQLSYASFFWALSDQVVGSMSAINSTQNSSTVRIYASISTGIERNSLLGSNDLDYFFDLASSKTFEVASHAGFQLSDQRLADKALARNRTLPDLIQELSANMTVSLLSDTFLG